MTEKEFNKLNKKQRIDALKTSGKYLGNRQTVGHFVHLYYLKPHYIEIWIIKGINAIHWIEIQKNKDIIATYADRVKIDQLFDSK